MEVLFQALYFLCLSSVCLGLQLFPPIKIKTPIGLDLRVDEINTNLLSNTDSKSSQPIPWQQCFCLPSNANSQPVISHVDPINKDIERKVVYLYKSNGVVKVYIPNKKKQELMPELNFDDYEGDILIPISSESIVQLFDPNINISPGKIVIGPETIDVETNKPQPTNIHIDNDEQSVENIDYISLSPDDNSLIQENNSIDEQNISINNILDSSSLIHDEAVNNPESNEIPNSSDANQLQQATTTSPSDSVSIDSQVTEIHEQNLDITPDSDDSNKPNEGTSILPSNSQSTDSPDNIKDHKINVIPDFDSNDQSQQIFSLLTTKPSSYLGPILQQNLYPLDSIINSYISFYDWFDLQLRRIVLYNFDTASKIIELRERIIKVLQDNGMHVGIKGIVTDSNGNLVRMNTIQLRPILIGSHGDSQAFQTLPETRVPYIQLIEIIVITPPKLLGTLVLGTVYLPRNINGQNFNLWNSYKGINIKHPLGCTTCKPKIPVSPIPQPLPLPTELHYVPVPIPYGQYHALPFRRNFSIGKPIWINKSASVGQRVPSAEPNRQIAGDASRSGIGSVIDGLLGNFGITHPNRRLLGGGSALPTATKQLPKTYPNDVLPGFRIVGGNAATSSGTPLVNKGRSGFRKPSFII